MHLKQARGRRGSAGRGIDTHGAKRGGRDSDVKSRKGAPYHYTECGLANVWLVNGFREETTPYGKAVAIDDMGGLHAAIAQFLVRQKPRWSGGEFRFIRKELDMSQLSLATVFGKDVQTIARWEKSGRVPRMADRFMRVLYQEAADGNEKIVDLVKRLNDTDQQEQQKMLFESQRGWQMRAAG